MASRPWHTLKSLGQGIRAVSNVLILLDRQGGIQHTLSPATLPWIDKRGWTVCSVEAASPCQMSTPQAVRWQAEMLQFGVFRLLRFRFHGASGLDDLAVSTEDRRGVGASWLRPNSPPDLRKYAIPTLV